MTESPRSFTLQVPQAQLDDLQARLARTRLPDAAPGMGWEHGTELGWVEQLLAYWRQGFDWRAQEARINAFPQFMARLSGIDLHFLHVRGSGPNPMPLLLAHGWPGSIVEFLELIPRLTTPERFGGKPEDAFSVVVPSLPGYGLSFARGQQRFSVEDMTTCFAELMSLLGYERYGTQGGDWGASVTARLAALHPQRVIGAHLNFLPLQRDLAVENPDAEQRAYLADVQYWLKERSAYSAIQGTRPQTLAYGLTDSPAGLAAWIAEKMQDWSDCGGEIERVFSKDQILANVCLYWFSAAIGSSFWPYYARAHNAAWPVPADPGVRVPMGYAEFPKEIMRPPRSLAERTFKDIRRWSVMPRGGHFAAFEQPELLAEELRQFFGPLREAQERAS